MEIKSILIKMKNRAKELWKYKIFRYAIILHSFYFILSLILTLIFFRNQNDFLVYYKVGEVFLTNIKDLYNRTNYLWPFRYFPISAVFFVPFYLLGFDLGFILFNLINLILNFLISLILYKIIKLVRNQDHEQDDKKVIIYISIFLMSLPNVFNYILGQINLYITFCVLISLYIFLKKQGIKWEFFASFILGISIIIKPITLFMIPFLIIINFNLESKKFSLNLRTSFVRIIGILTPLSLNVIVFLLYPKLWEDFLLINFTGDEPIILNHSFSITKLIVNFCIFFNINYNPLVIILIISVFFGGVGFIIFILRRRIQNSLVVGYLFGILIMLLAYFDSWDHHLLILTPMLIIFLFILPRDSPITTNYIKSSYFFLSFFDLISMGIFFVIKDFFPFNFPTTFFLLLVFYGVSKYCIGTNNRDLNKY